jgi:hypothetical protein
LGDGDGVRADPAAALRFDSTGRATLHGDGRTFNAGRFETPRLGALRRRAEETKAKLGTTGSIRFFVLDGPSIATDIGTLQAMAPANSLFQVASQFNCLEAPSPYITDVAAYLDDPTQGPRASISAFPGTFVRHFAAHAGDGTPDQVPTGGVDPRPMKPVIVGVVRGRMDVWFSVAFELQFQTRSRGKSRDLDVREARGYRTSISPEAVSATCHETTCQVPPQRLSFFSFFCHETTYQVPTQRLSFFSFFSSDALTLGTTRRRRLWRGAWFRAPKGPARPESSQGSERVPPSVVGWDCSLSPGSTGA